MLCCAIRWKCRRYEVETWVQRGSNSEVQCVSLSATNGLSVPLRLNKLSRKVPLSRQRPRVRVPSSPPFYLKELSDVTPKTPTHNHARSFYGTLPDSNPTASRNFSCAAIIWRGLRPCTGRVLFPYLPLRSPWFEGLGHWYLMAFFPPSASCDTQ